MPGRIGAIPTPAFTPAATSLLSASSRRRGGGVPGSVRRQTSSSSVGTEKTTPTSARDAASTRTSRSRTTIGLRVIRLNGFDASWSASRQPRVSLYRPSAGW